MTEPADSFAWDFADEHLLVLLAHLPTQQLLRCARVSRQFRAIAGELMRRGLSPGSACHAHWAAGTVEWAAGEALAVARGEVEDLSSEGPRRRKAGASAAAKASIVVAMLRLATAQAFKGLACGAVPDVAFVFATDSLCASKAKTCDLADSLSRLLPPSTLVIATRSTGVIGPAPCAAEAYDDGAAGWDAPAVEIEDGRALVVLLGALPGREVSWLAGQACGTLTRHEGAWWQQSPAASPPPPPARTHGDPTPPGQTLREFVDGGEPGCGFVCLSTPRLDKMERDLFHPQTGAVEQSSRGDAGFALAGGVAEVVALRAPRRSASSLGSSSSAAAADGAVAVSALLLRFSAAKGTAEEARPQFTSATLPSDLLACAPAPTWARYGVSPVSAASGLVADVLERSFHRTTTGGKPAPLAATVAHLAHNLQRAPVTHSAAAAAPPPRPRCAIVFACNGRGADGHHGRRNVDAGAFASLLQSVAAGDTAEGAPAQRPVAGIMAGGEFGREGPDSDDEDFASGDASAGRNTLGLAFSCVGAMLS